MPILHIKEPFYTAGRKFGWTGDPTGIGIHSKLIQEDKILQVKIRDNPKILFLKCNEALKFIQQNNSWFYTKRGTRLGIVPLTLLRREVGTTLNNWIE